ncbi:toll/interleukin-1 receptor domain-containing protein [Catellatospora sichuanensis]|uniref:toll/interleukin-1 receptor domain-containing protein n=1 Tax=Catellatospora sichuanensis TaxID=1969805 RepID=UPI0016431C02|nr:toll/interleukin-1 receptor domain-containing protein [Catellatospora sichuanensis]
MSGPVFISFSREHDAAYVGRLAAHLVAGGLSMRYDTQPMTDGWWSTYTRAQLDGSSAVVVVMTPAASHDGWVAREIDHARLLGRPIVPLLLAGEPFPALSGYAHEDVTGGRLPGPELVRRLHRALGNVPPQAAEPTASSAFTVPIRGGATGLTVGIEVRGAMFMPLIERGQAVPCARTEVFTTADDDQPVIQVRVFQGQSPAVAANESLGAYELLLEPAPAGVPQIGVRFEVTESGAFRLTAAHADGREVPVRLLPGKATASH